jgi:phytoene desaturase
MTRNVIIIGAGLSGLATGIYAQANGYQSQIFDHHRVPGGVAASWTRGRYHIDGGIHFVMGHRPGTSIHQLYRELQLDDPQAFIEITTYGRFVDESDGQQVMVTRDLQRFAADLKAIAPNDASVIDELISGALHFRRVDLSTVGMEKPPELSGVVDQIKELWRMRSMYRYFSGRYARPVADFVETVKSPWLRQCLQNLFLPEVPTWFIMMILATLTDGQMAYLKGGCHDFVSTLVRHYQELGGSITFSATVTAVLVESDRAIGVQLSDGSKHYADSIVATGDGQQTIFELLGGQYRDHDIERRYREWPLCRPLFMASFGVARDFSGEPPLSYIKLDMPIELGDTTVRGMMLRIFNYSDSFAPPGKTVVQAELETDWDYWHQLKEHDSAAYDRQKNIVAVEVLSRLEKYYPGITSQVEVSDMATPHTTWRYTLNQQGSWGGWLMSAELLQAKIPRTLPGLNNLYLAGQWVMPGGVVPSLFSGRHAVQLMCRHDGRDFTPSFMSRSG